MGEGVMEKWDVVGVKGCGCVGEGGGYLNRVTANR